MEDAQRRYRHSGAYTIPDFCHDHGISIPFFHKLRGDGQGPDVMRVGSRTLVSYEAAARWRKERERVGREVDKAKAIEKAEAKKAKEMEEASQRASL